MEKLNLQQTPKKVASQGICGLCVLTAFIVAIAVILSSESTDCDNPIREWLIVWICVNSGSFVLLTIGSIIALKKPDSVFVKIIKISTLIITLFFLAWLIVGSVWLFTDDNCKDDFYDMWALTLAILIMTYICFGCCCIAICCLGITMCIKGKTMMGKAGEKSAI